MAPDTISELGAHWREPSGLRSSQLPYFVPPLVAGRESQFNSHVSVVIRIKVDVYGLAAVDLTSTGHANGPFG